MWAYIPRRYIQYSLPRDGMPPLATLFSGLEACRARFGLEDYLLSQTSLDAVFCRFADLQDSDRSIASANLI